MWVAKFKSSGEDTLIGSRTKKFNITATGYPLSYNKTKDAIYVSAAGLLFGEEKNKKKFIADIKKAKRMLKFEVKGDFVICLMKEDLEIEPFYNPSIIHLKPIIIAHDGFEYWEVASWDKKVLTDLIELIKRKFKGELFKLKQEKISNISILTIIPELTAKQKRALELAVKSGYYEYPKKIELKQLAKLMKVSYSTYQAHLRKAEKKIIPFIGERL